MLDNSLRYCLQFSFKTLFYSLFYISLIGDVNATEGVFKDAFKNHYIQRLETGNFLELIYRENLNLDGSSPPMDTINKLYDGITGDTTDFNTFLSFDGPTVKLTMNIQSWRKVDRISFTALELLELPSSKNLIFNSLNSLKQEISLTRKIIETVQVGLNKNTHALVEYTSPISLGLSDGTLELDYLVNGLSKAYIGEFILDDIKLDDEKTPKTENYINSLEMWENKVGKVECSKLQKLYAPLHLKPTDQKLNLFFGNINNMEPPKLLYWKKFRDITSSVEINSFMFKVDNTGKIGLDFVEAWLIVPYKNRMNLPLIILPQQGHVYGGLESLGVMGEKELGVAGSLAEQGIASLSLNSFRFGKVNKYMLPTFFEKYPNSGTTAKDLMNLFKALDLLTDVHFKKELGYKFDKKKIGIWGFSYGAWISMLAGVMDERINAVSFSSFHYNDSDIAYGLSSSLYIPQLSCLDNWKNPISVSKILKELNKNVFTVAPDLGLASKWQKNLYDQRVQIVVNPYGHVVTEHERAEILNFFYNTFSKNTRDTTRGPKHDLPIDADGMAPYIARENKWRKALLDAMRK